MVLGLQRPTYTTKLGGQRDPHCTPEGNLEEALHLIGHVAAPPVKPVGK